ncbi:MAG: hypothetical protein ACOX3E_00785 [Desulfomonilia bacterium]
MRKFEEYDRFDALGLAELVRKREVTPEELMEEAIDRIEELNPALNAVVYRMYDQAAEVLKAGLPQGPFTGVPFCSKTWATPAPGCP